MNDFENLIDELKQCEQVSALALGGSRAGDTYDESSDYDLYVYLNAPLDLKTREKILSRHCRYLEMNNQFWETEDDCTLNCGIDIDILYRDPEEIDGMLEYVVKNCNPYNGYTTCMWDNVANCRILYDPQHVLKNLKDKYSLDYPDQLSKNIVLRNRKLLSGFLPSYAGQIRKAVERNDLPSISHRTAAFMESYFDIIFALNKVKHPGEKRMQEKAVQLCTSLPADFSKNIETLYAVQFHDSALFLETMDEMIRNLDFLIQQNT